MSRGTAAAESRAEARWARQQALVRANWLRAEAATLRVASAALREEARRLRRHRECADVGFHIEGVVDGATVWADWSPSGLAACPTLRQRAELVVALGDRIGGPGQEGPACLDEGPTSALLTLMRACDRVRTVSLHIRSLAAEDEIGAYEEIGPGTAAPDRINPSL